MALPTPAILLPAIGLTAAISISASGLCFDLFRCGGVLSVADAAAGVLSVAAFWAGAAHPRRQKHREMPPPGASAPAFAATVEPTFTQITFDLPPAHLQSDSSNERVLGMTCCVHRFLISGPNLRIDARFSRFTATCVHRFLILGGQFGNHCRFFPVYALLRAVILDLRG